MLLTESKTSENQFKKVLLPSRIKAFSDKVDKVKRVGNSRLMSYEEAFHFYYGCTSNQVQRYVWFWSKVELDRAVSKNLPSCEQNNEKIFPRG